MIADSCLDRICGPYEQCVEDSAGVASCLCQECDSGGRDEEDGEGEEERVCGSDGITYFSLCHLQRASCTQGGQDIEALHQGPCGRWSRQNEQYDGNHTTYNPPLYYEKAS